MTSTDANAAPAKTEPPTVEEIIADLPTGGTVCGPCNIDPNAGPAEKVDPEKVVTTTSASR